MRTKNGIYCAESDEKINWADLHISHKMLENFIRRNLFNNKL